jgi:hypothetical protein
MEYWSYVEGDMTLYPEILPNGLPQTNALCIVVLGYALANDGSMRQELIGRLQVDFGTAQNGLEKILDNHGEVESFFNILVYQTGYPNVRFVSSENFDTKDNDYIQYKLAFVKA